MGSLDSTGFTFVIFILFLFALFLIPWNGQKYELFTLGKWKNAEYNPIVPARERILLHRGGKTQSFEA